MDDRYISRKAIQQVLYGIANGLSVGETEALKTKDMKALYKIKGAKEILTAIDNDLSFIPAADVQPVPRWISVEDRLPDENQKCLVYRDIDADLKITTGIWHSERKAFDGLRHGTRLEDTIAWIPLPEPPKDGDTNG